MGYFPTKDIPFTADVHRVSDHVWAWLRPGGGFCLSNSGLIASGDTSLVVDTLIDIPSTETMLAAYAKATAAAKKIDLVFNTHAHPDHTAGNWLLRDSHLIMTPACAEEHRPLEQMIRMTELLTGDALELMKELGVGAFSTEGVRFIEPHQTFEGETAVDVDALEVRLIEVGSVHSHSDSIAYIPADGVVIAGDLLFEGCHPVIGFPFIENWHHALDLMLAWEADTFVPGHGRICGRDEVLRHKQYLAEIEGETLLRFEKGMTEEEAALDWFYHLGPQNAVLFRADNILRNVTALYARFSGKTVKQSFADAMAARWRFRQKIRGIAKGIHMNHVPDGN